MCVVSGRLTGLRCPMVNVSVDWICPRLHKPWGPLAFAKVHWRCAVRGRRETEIMNHNVPRFAVRLQKHIFHVAKYRLLDSQTSAFQSTLQSANENKTFKTKTFAIKNEGHRDHKSVSNTLARSSECAVWFLKISTHYTVGGPCCFGRDLVVMKVNICPKHK